MWHLAHRRRLSRSADGKDEDIAPGSATTFDKTPRQPAAAGYYT
jgi:hypothetical protein